MTLWVWFMLVFALAAVLFYFLMPRFNGADWGNPFLNRLDGLNRLFCRFVHGLPKESFSLPQAGAAIVVANHISGLDPLLMLAASPRPLRFLIAREQYERFGMTWLFRAVGAIPVDRTGRPEKAMRDAIAALKAGEVVAIFPHGTIHLPKDPPRKLKGGAARLASIVECPLHVLMIEGVAAKGAVVAAVFVPSRSSIREVAVLPAQIGADSMMEQLELIYNCC